ncbi:DUF4124 domain-containing protein [Xanthomonas sp. MUS 060]|uniref:DUF4124 domain-containing protein n=1 Tax=Xanthomonas sp. MUS 060 TaxID=1588031 RepID=UPI0005F2AF3C|nr:DUF4124 domain-containing protein [Xanthomonas sp. MUS 060]
MRALPRFFCCLPLFAASGMLGATTLYQWKDAQGVTHYAEAPPPGVKYQERRIDAHGDTSVDPQAASPAENPNCLIARKNLDILNKPGKITTDSKGDGKPDGVLDESQRATQKALAEAAIKAYCTPTPAAK